MTVSSNHQAPGFPRDANGRTLNWPWRVLLAVLAGLLTAAAGHGQWFWKQDEALYDATLRHWGYAPDPRLLIIAIDAPSLQQLGPWPWPRATHARLLDRLTEAGSRRVVLDLLLAEPDEDASQDAELAAAIRRNGQVVLPMVALSKARSGMAEELLPIPMIAANATTLGHSDIEVDPDGITRGLYLTAGIGSPHWPALGAALADRRGPLPGLRTVAAPSDSPWQWRRNHQVRVRYAGPAHSFPQLSYVEVLKGAVDPATLRGRLVVVGMTTPDAAAPVLTPTAPTHGMSGAEFQANVAAMLLDDQVVTLPARPWQALLGGLLVALCVLALGRRRAWPSALLAVPLVLLGSLALLRVGHVWFAPGATVAGLLLVIAVWAAWRAVRWRRAGRTDPVTGLATRQRFDTQLRHACDAAQRARRPLSVALLEVDHFTPLVELHGHGAGQAALRGVARQLAAHARRPQDLCARVGTARFGLLLPDTPGEGAAQLLEGLVAHVRELHVPVQLGQTTPITLTAGVFTGVPDAGTDAAVFLQRAEAALQRARALGGDGYAADGDRDANA